MTSPQARNSNITDNINHCDEQDNKGSSIPTSVLFVTPRQLWCGQQRYHSLGVALVKPFFFFFRPAAEQSNGRLQHAPAGECIWPGPQRPQLHSPGQETPELHVPHPGAGPPGSPGGRSGGQWGAPHHNCSPSDPHQVLEAATHGVTLLVLTC